jgi:hypothetical protein
MLRFSSQLLFTPFPQGVFTSSTLSPHFLATCDNHANTTLIPHATDLYDLHADTMLLPYVYLTDTMPLPYVYRTTSMLTPHVLYYIYSL